MNGLILLFLVFIALVVAWAISELKKKKTTTASSGSGWTEVPLEIVESPRGKFVEEVLLDDGENYYEVKRGSRRTFVNQWRALPGSWKQAVYETDVRGIQHRKDAAKRFLQNPAPWLNLEREPTNEHDPNAIKVMSTWQNPDGSVHREHLGYVAKEEAALIVGDLSPDHPIVATIVSMAPSSQYGASVYIRIHVATSWCPLCKGDLGRAPRQPGTCKSCGGSFKMSLQFRVPIPA